MNFIHENHKVYVKNDEGSIIVNATFPLIEPGVVNINHTYVDPSLRGQGVASTLMHEVIKHIESQKLKLVATCPYAVVWLKKHQEFAHLIDENVQLKLAPECQI
jgi:uncharacterized protein